LLRYGLVKFGNTDFSTPGVRFLLAFLSEWKRPIGRFLEPSRNVNDDLESFIMSVGGHCNVIADLEERSFHPNTIDA
jgi:hypothetical protein